jgi:hypothetical protein
LHLGHGVGARCGGGEAHEEGARALGDEAVLGLLRGDVAVEPPVLQEEANLRCDQHRLYSPFRARDQ